MFATYKRAMDKLLIKNIKKGCLRSYEVVFNKYYNILYAYANRIITDSESAKEIVNDCFIKLWEHKMNVKNDVDSLKPYLFQITHNLCINHLRKNENVGYKVDLQNVIDDFAYELMQLENSELEKAINLAIDKLPSERKKIFLLSRKEELKHNEIAQKLGISKKTVETQIGRSLSFLREQLKKYKI